MSIATDLFLILAPTILTVLVIVIVIYLITQLVKLFTAAAKGVLETKNFQGTLCEIRYPLLISRPNIKNILFDSECGQLLKNVGL